MIPQAKGNMRETSGKTCPFLNPRLRYTAKCSPVPLKARFLVFTMLPFVEREGFTMSIKTLNNEVQEIKISYRMVLLMHFLKFRKGMWWS
ncbi:hypothetical protein CVN76_13850 [Bacillus sp. mrc49]|nr:hypothetical protein CVN76_13850 [Bacillus sp. mrc49]